MTKKEAKKKLKKLQRKLGKNEYMKMKILQDTYRKGRNYDWRKFNKKRSKIKKTIHKIKEEMEWFIIDM